MLYSTSDKLLIVGGANFSEDLFEEVYDNGTPIIAADGGANFLADRNISPDLIIGDLDSISHKTIQNIETEKVIAISDQNTTDLEKVLSNTESSLTIGIGFLGSRIDHELASLSALVKFSHKKIILIGNNNGITLNPLFEETNKLEVCYSANNLLNYLTKFSRKRDKTKINRKLQNFYFIKFSKKYFKNFYN